MISIRSSDAQISYEMLGDGPTVVLLHPFPANHELWLPAAQQLASRYRVILPDLRGHGESDVGEGPATMAKHAADISRILDDAKVGRAVFAGVSIGGYVLFEFWRRNRDRFSALVLIDTKAAPDTPDGRAGRLRSAADVLERGVEPFIESMLPKLLGETTRHARPDLVEAAQKMMLKMSPEDISLVLKGMAERPDSIPTAKTINVPSLIVVGDEDTLTPVADAELMKQNISGSQMKVIPKAGHYAVWEQSDETGKVLRHFLDMVHGA
jgi:pimeloyl-ACP methyl ester carboxylesterase